MFAPVERCWICDGATLHRHGGYRYAVYPRCPGRAPDLENSDVLQWLGRFIGLRGPGMFWMKFAVAMNSTSLRSNGTPT